MCTEWDSHQCTTLQQLGKRGACKDVGRRNGDHNAFVTCESVATTVDSRSGVCLATLKESFGFACPKTVAFSIERNRLTRNAPLPVIARKLTCQMEGFLLVFSQERSAQVQYCVLEHGMLRCFDQPGGVLRESVGLTRHRIRVQPLVSDNAGLCPNRFAVHALEVKRNDQAGAFVSAGKREKTYCFAAATSKTMIKWANAIHNWRRHAFDDPTSSALSVHDAITSNAMQNPDTKQRAVLLESQRANLVNLANRFDVKLVSGNANTGKMKSRGLFSGPSFRVSSTHKIPAEIKTSRASFAIISWLPGFSSLQPSLSGR